MEPFQTDHFLEPPQALTAAGEERRVGVELELSGPDVLLLVERVEDHFGGQRIHLSDYEWELADGRLGTFRIEVDFELLKRLGRQEKAGGDWLDTVASRALGSLSKGIVPLEIVSPPVPVSRLQELDALFVRLQQDGAKGTRDAPWNAFGLHLNPEAPDLTAPTLLAYLQAYMCLHDWLVEVESVDLSRRIAPYINPFNTDYVKHVLRADYQPELDQLIDDYLRFNPTRNRALDMLPVFAHVDEERVRGSLDSPLIKPRPTFHYRLPNCEIDDPHWRLHRAWNHWWQVETLACDTTRLQAVCRHYLQHLQRLAPVLFKPWRSRVQQWLIDPASQ